MIETVRNAWKIPELRRKIIFTLFILLIYRVGNAVPVPYVNLTLLEQYFSSMGNTALGLMNAMSGGAFSRATIFALSIQPYINSSIIIQLLTVAIPALERLQKDGGEEGKKKLAAITRYVTVAIALLQGFGYYSLMRVGTASSGTMLTDSSFWAGAVIVLSFTAGSTFVMWLGEQITEFGIGNGISIILFASIVARGPSMLYSLFIGLRNHYSGIALQKGAVNFSGLGVAGILVGLIAIVIFIVFISLAERRIPIQYAKRVVGRKMYGGQSSHLPIKLSMTGVMPIIFAQAIATLPATVAAFLPSPKTGSFWSGFLSAIGTTSPIYIIVYFLLILGFSYFYASIQFNPIEISNNLKKNGGFIPGFRPGKPTADFIRHVLGKITLFGAIYLAVIAIVPIITGAAINVSSLAIGGTSVIIVVGVALETVKALEAQMLMRHYKGFLE
ncbi:MAG: preprotein translocase subunit SecY [Oscillospiraceae bacterium]|nr:preprotein translocase subunit SecY [Oscillospiraceae bacterium]